MTNVVQLHAGQRMLIIGSSMGAGHMTAAHVLAKRARRRGATTRVVDYLSLPRGPQGRLVRALYRHMISREPWLYSAIMRGWAAHPVLFERFSAVGERGYIRGLDREVDVFQPDVVISTYNLAGQLLGRMRNRGALSVPAVAYITDAGAHPYWIAAGADLHLAPLDSTAQELRRLGARHVQTVQPLVDEPAHLSRDEARERLGVTTAGPLALVNGGSWGIGAVVEAAAAVAVAGVHSYVLCGNADGLAERVERAPNCHAVDWTTQVPTWIAAADVVIDSAGGTTCWEALVAERPVILHRPVAGHGRLNAVALHKAGLASVTHTTEQLVCAMREVHNRPGPEIPPQANVVDSLFRAA